MSEHPLRIFTGNAHPKLAAEIANLLDVPLGKSTTTIFPDSETYVTIDEVVRGQDIFIVQPCSSPVDNHIMELLLYLDAFRRASVHSVSVVMPYFPYARQDRMAKGREAISARVVANLLEDQGADRVIYVDIHNPAIQGFFNIPVDPLTAIPVLADTSTGTNSEMLSSSVRMLAGQVWRVIMLNCLICPWLSCINAAHHQLKHTPRMLSVIFAAGGRL